MKLFKRIFIIIATPFVLFGVYLVIHGILDYTTCYHTCRSVPEHGMYRIHQRLGLDFETSEKLFELLGYVDFNL